MRRFALLFFSLFLSTFLFSQNVNEQTAKKQKIEEEISYLDSNWQPQSPESNPTQKS